MVIRNTDGSYGVHGTSYDLLIRGHIVEVLVSGNVFAALDIRTAVNATEEDGAVLKDAEASVPTLTDISEEQGKTVFTWTNTSSLWEKKYTLTCTYLRFRFSLTVRGKGRVDSVNYFSGDMSDNMYGSEYEFCQGYFPCKSWYENEDYYFLPNARCYRWSVLMVPPMFCYAFRCADVRDQLALGLVAERGQHNFHSFTYNVSPEYNYHKGFYLTTDQDGHTAVDGEWTAPCIIGYGALDEFNAVQKYSDYYFSTGIAQAKKKTPIPRFWYGPLACGWIEQRSYISLACEETYERIHSLLKENDLHPSALIIDDKWMCHYATDEADPEKWPDLRAYVDRHAAEGIRTMLWFKLWDPDGWDTSLCVTTDNGEVRIDPSHPLFLENLDKALYRILAADEGCYNCDGLKLDFAFFNPIGKNFRTYSGKYGVELLYDMMEYIYRKAKEIKPTALINCSPCHPYFAHICDQARLHDYDRTKRNNLEDLSARARLFSIAIPDTLLDTDNSGFISRRDTMRWQLNQQTIGVPDLYAISPTVKFDINKDDLGAIAEMWREYSAKIDAAYTE